MKFFGIFMSKICKLDKLYRTLYIVHDIYIQK